MTTALLDDIFVSLSLFPLFLSIVKFCNEGRKMHFTFFTFLFIRLCVCICACVCAFVSAEALKSQLDQGEEKSSKMKQLLVKTKKDLADAKKQVCVCVP